jgi:hypothetical protein
MTLVIFHRHVDDAIDATVRIVADQSAVVDKRNTLSARPRAAGCAAARRR